MIKSKSTNIKLNGYYGTWMVVSELKHNGNKAFLLESEYKEYEDDKIIVNEDGLVLVEDGRTLKDFIKYVDDLEFYYGGSLRRR